MEDYIFTPIVFALGLLIHLAVARRSTPAEARGLAVAFLAHVFAALLQVWLLLYYFNGGDMLGYFSQGVPLAELIRSDPWRYLPELWTAFVRGNHHLPVEFVSGESTQSMGAAAAFLLLLTGDSLYAATMLVGVAAYLSQFMLYRAFRDLFPRDQWNLVLIGTCLIPSGVFWSSAILKEPLVMVAIGPIVLGLSWLANGRRMVGALALMSLPVVILLLLKPYVLMAISIAAGVFFGWRRLQTSGAAELKPFAILFAGILTATGLVIGARFFTKAESTSAAATFASQRQLGYTLEGGSNYYLDQGDVEASEERSLSQELAVAPWALFTALFRPFIFEVRNAVQLANALEASVLMIWFIQILARLGYRRVIREVAQSPALMFCVTFTLALGLGTGLASSNLGTLSRYRAPMMPFYFTTLVVLRFGMKSRATTLQSQLVGAGSPAR